MTILKRKINLLPFLLCDDFNSASFCISTFFSLLPSPRLSFQLLLEPHHHSHFHLGSSPSSPPPLHILFLFRNYSCFITTYFSSFFLLLPLYLGFLLTFLVLVLSHPLVLLFPSSSSFKLFPYSSISSFFSFLLPSYSFSFPSFSFSITLSLATPPVSSPPLPCMISVLVFSHPLLLFLFSLHPPPPSSCIFTFFPC